MNHIQVGSLITHVFFESEYMLVIEDHFTHFIVIDLTDRTYHIERTEVYKDYITLFCEVSNIFVEG